MENPNPNSNSNPKSDPETEAKREYLMLEIAASIKALNVGISDKDIMKFAECYVEGEEMGRAMFHALPEKTSVRKMSLYYAVADLVIRFALSNKDQHIVDFIREVKDYTIGINNAIGQTLGILHSAANGEFKRRNSNSKGN